MRTFLVLVAFLLAAASGVCGGLLSFLFPLDELQTITVTDVPEDSPAARAPTPAQPVYYLPVCVGYRDFGGVIAGDKPPKKEDMIRVIAKVLAKQGFLPANAQHPATQMILFAWGTFYPDSLEIPPYPGVQFNYGQELAFLGGARIGIPEVQSHPAFPEIEGLTFSTPQQEQIRTAARDLFYVAKIAAYDLSLTAGRKPRLLWSTRISGFARGRYMVDALPAIVVMGGPNIGRDTPSPVWTRASDRFKAEVILGQPKLEEFLGSGVLPVIDASAVRSKDGR